MANADRCPDCGANLAMVGIRHRCISVRREPERVLTGPTSDNGRPAAVMKSGARDGESEAMVPRDAQSTSTYLYRDPVKRREQMRLYMKAYRARKRA